MSFVRQLGGERLCGILGGNRVRRRRASVAGDERLDARLGHLESLLELGGVPGGGVGPSPVRGERGEQRPFGELTRAQFAGDAGEFSGGVVGLGLSVADQRADNLLLQVRLEFSDGVGGGGRALELLSRGGGSLPRGSRVSLGDPRPAGFRIRAVGLRPSRLLGSLGCGLRRDAPSLRGRELLADLYNPPLRELEPLVRARRVHGASSRQTFLGGYARGGCLLPSRRPGVQRSLHRRGTGLGGLFASLRAACLRERAAHLPFSLEHQLSHALDDRARPPSLSLELPPRADNRRGDWIVLVRASDPSRGGGNHLLERVLDPLADARGLEHGGHRILRLHGHDRGDILGSADEYPRADGSVALDYATRGNLHGASRVELGGLEPVRGSLALRGELLEVPRVLFLERISRGGFARLGGDLRLCRRVAPPGESSQFLGPSRRFLPRRAGLLPRELLARGRLPGALLRGLDVPPGGRELRLYPGASRGFPLRIPG